MIRAIAAFASAAIVATTASAQNYVFKANGIVASASSADRNFQQVPNPPSSVAIGDSFSVQFTLNPVGAGPDSYFDADPTVNIYSYYVTDFTMAAGSNFIIVPATNERTFASFQLWNNRVIDGIADPVDSFTLSILRYLPSGTSPVDLGAGAVNTQFHYNAYDFTGSARNSDLLNELPPLEAYGSRSGFFAVFNADSWLQTDFQLNFTSASLTAVPEPATWMMLLIGFGFLGASIRGASRPSVRYCVRTRDIPCS